VIDQKPALGHLAVDGEFATITFERSYPHPIEDVWSAITEPAELAGWFMTEAKIKAGTGGTVDLVSGPSHFHITGTILAWEPPHLFEHEWNVPPRSDLPKGEQAFVRWELTEVGGRTLVKMSFRHLHRGTAGGFISGMHAFLDRLGAQLDGATLPDWMGRVQELRKGYAGPRR
jgi:uncharacterized protein YndB with AHSA1/START domain